MCHRYLPFLDDFAKVKPSVAPYALGDGESPYCSSTVVESEDSTVDDCRFTRGLAHD